MCLTFNDQSHPVTYIPTKSSHVVLERKFLLAKLLACKFQLEPNAKHAPISLSASPQADAVLPAGRAGQRARGAAEEVPRADHRADLPLHEGLVREGIQ